MLLTARHDQKPSFDKLFAIALGQAGYFTAVQAKEAGYSLQLLQHHLRHGSLERAARGIFRLVHFPATDEADFIVPWLWSGRRGVVSHESALQLHDLADALPARVHLSLPTAVKRRRLQAPPTVIVVYADVPTGELAWHGAVPVTSPLRTLRDCLEAHVTPEWIQQAIDRGLRRGLFSRSELSSFALPVGVVVPAPELT